MIKLISNPTEEHLADIESWLVEEWNKTQNGFYSDWSMIPNAFKENRLSVITDNDYAIGFVVYRISEFEVDIDITEIKPTERNRGVARQLINETLNFLKLKGVLVARLFCQPTNSEPFWKKIGFNNFPQIIDNKQIHMFKPLIETLKPTEKIETNSTIRLWNCPPHQADRISAKWAWDLNFKEDNETLVKPIISPVSREWQVQLIINGEESKPVRVKNLQINLNDDSEFMIVRNVTAKK
ncbi:acetyltransferase (GNAT) family protein [Roseivirga ehrenbergii]|uniref:N-acetyltransferase domain-containing protein n=1 Tax=Roseivirga ehrenbergii (strain DSM 102268 / JCM 13514 / KCTC 12282 / NCIMB 14502 / KMM 6017) TaxID=279360 RepID=A0A150XKD4_ROSEK|nr:GNAT family N-acetyltransferase [Roseivirga ehrenbergii]KYG79082.1 hypothetical protein MB14_17385 [Roseivirga ehrenbergii]TCK99121.1 acetyltransferase (GNAT) family protein [Roseivirga ehrenbergii]